MATPSPLVSSQELMARLLDPDVRIVDCRWYLGRPGRGRQAYDAGHIPGAIFIDVDTDLVAAEGPGRHPLPDPVDFSRRLGQLGIGSQHEIVAYDDAGGGVAARLWWMLDDLGHGAVAVLDGGYPAWVRAGLPTSTAGSRHPPARLDLASRWTKVIDRAVLKDRLGLVVLLDARAGARYRGEIEPIDPLPGHIPTAVSAPTDENLEPDGRFRPADDLRSRFDQLAGAGAASDVVTSCGSGVSACQNALAMRIAGLPDPILYPGSYSDWSRSGEPVATGPAPGEPPA